MAQAVSTHLAQDQAARFEEAVGGIDGDRARQGLVAGLVSFGRIAGCRLLAEGIETEAELATVRALGVELGQGYLLGRPAPLPALVGEEQTAA